MMNGMEFANTDMLYLLLLIPLAAAFQLTYLKRKKTTVPFSDTSTLMQMPKSWKTRLAWVPDVMRYVAIFCIIIGLARPRSSSSGSNVTSEGISIVLALDVSGSMLAEDLKPNRIEAAKKVAKEFIQGRNNDLIGLVVFSGESFTQCPITSDHSVLLNMMDGLKSGMLSDGTAIGEGLATAVSRIKDSPTKSKVIILLTDGENNVGSVAPTTAGEIAQAFGIRVYTIGVGRNGMAPFPFQTPFGIQYQNVEVRIDEPVLKQISATTDGKYFRATDNKKLSAIYSEIDQLEKTKVEVTEFRRYTEEFMPFALAALAFVLLEFLMRLTLFKRIPA
jgi:Ca-activated chloride channel family protein